jgi:hypothetical protein
MRSEEGSTYDKGRAGTTAGAQQGASDLLTLHFGARIVLRRVRTESMKMERYKAAMAQLGGRVGVLLEGKAGHGSAFHDTMYDLDGICAASCSSPARVF